MEIYYTTKIEGRTGSVAAWSKAPGYPALLAVALSPSAVGVFTEEGRPLDPAKPSLISNVRSTECQRLAWHPLLPLLAIGWKDGGISFWNCEDRHMEEDSKTHRTAVMALLWSASGDRLISADETGKVTVWKTDRLLRPIHVVSYEEQPGSKVGTVCLGPVAVMPETGSPATTVYYSVHTHGKSVLKWANDQGYQGLVQDMPETVASLLFYPEKSELLAVGDSGTLFVLAQLDTDGGLWRITSQLKLAATGGADSATGHQVCWAAPHTLATASGKDGVVRMYNRDTEDNYVLQADAGAAASGEAKAPRAAAICCLAADLRFGLLAAGLTNGRITVFRHAPPPAEAVSDLAKHWEPQPAFSIGGAQATMEWGPSPRLMVTIGPSGVHACRKALLRQCFRDDVLVIQTGVDSLVLESLANAGKRPPAKLTLPFQILGLDYSRGTLLVWDGSTAHVYRVGDAHDVTQQATIQGPYRAMAVNNDSIFRSAEGRLEICNLTGTVKQTLPFDEMPGVAAVGASKDGAPCMMDCTRDYLAAVSAGHTLRVLKVAGREARPHQGPDLMLTAEMGGASLVVDALRVNSSGSMVAALCSSPGTGRDARLFVHCFENHTTHAYDFGQEHRSPEAVAWDAVESNVLAVQTLSEGRGKDVVDGADAGGKREVAVCFASPDHGILLQEYQALESAGVKGFVGLQAPHLLVNKPTAVTSGGPAGTFTTHAARVVMTTFAGLQDGDGATRAALLDFSYHLATGNMDEAFRAVKAIKNTSVWESMAHTCIKNKRLDVAEHCLGNMGHARGARAAREAKSIEELDARIGMVAIHLGMTDDARKLFVSAERQDLLVKLHQACGQWDKALEVAEKHDRIHLKSVHFAYAQHLEKVGALKEAMEHYEAAGSATVQVTRMLYQAGRFQELEEYVTSHPDNRQLAIWWARYCESQGETARALAAYERVGDALAVVRLHCLAHNFAAAEEQVKRVGDEASAFYLARQYEAHGQAAEAIKLYAAARRYSHGVRLAKSAGLDTELVNLALKSSPPVMVDAADYLNEKGDHERAALLYMKGGKLSKAVDMCIAAQLFDVLQHIADDLGAGRGGGHGDAALLTRCADFFIRHGHFDKAARMLIAGGQYSRALEMCVEHDVPLTEDMAEAMTPSKDALPAEERTLVLTRIAKLAKRQGAWQLAAKKFTQAGDKIKAMKALLRCGDTEKVIFFAGVSRHRDVYLMAANYLQTLAWHSDPDIMKHIVTFYTKAQALEALASFYEACAQVEIDEYRDYDKALQALREALKQLAKAKGDGVDLRAASMQRRIAQVEKFVTARNAISSQPQQALSLCSELLLELPGDGSDVEAGIREGDVYALMVEYHYQARNLTEAYQLIERMRSRGILLGPYLEQRLVDDVYTALGLQPMLGQSVHAGAGAHGASQGRQGYTSGGGYVDDEDMMYEDDGLAGRY